VPGTSTPASPVSPQMIEMDLVMVTRRSRPDRGSLFAAGAVFEIAPAKVLHGAVRLHGLTSSPTPETQVRVAWALAGAADRRKVSAAPRIVKNPSLSASCSHLSCCHPPIRHDGQSNFTPS